MMKNKTMIFYKEIGVIIVLHPGCNPFELISCCAVKDMYLDTVCMRLEKLERLII